MTLAWGAPRARSGNVFIETAFYDDDLLVCKNVLRVFYDL